MFFVVLVTLTALLIAGCAAFFSIYGLAHVFSGAFISVIVMASALEAGKLVGASLLYRYWKHLGSILILYLMLAIFVLMSVTSAGIFGYLSKAYQEDVLPLDEMQARIEFLQNDKNDLQSLRAELVARKSQIDSEISGLPNDFITARQRLRETYKDELAKLSTDIESYTRQINGKTAEIESLSGEILEQRVKIGPIIFIAETFGFDADNATVWLIGLIIFAFDPLAVALIIGANIAFFAHQEKKATSKLTKKDDTEIETDENESSETNPSMDLIDGHVLDIVNDALEKTSLTDDQKGAIDTLFRRDQIHRRVRTQTSS